MSDRRKVGRRHHQDGYLHVRGGKRRKSWAGTWRIYSNGKSERVEYHLGFCDEVTEAEARAKMRDIIRKTQSQTHAVDSIGRESTIEAPPRDGNLLPAKVGAISELLVCADLSAKGWDVFRAVDPTCSCDLLCVRGSEVVRVEVKTERIGLKLSDKAGKFDVLALVSSSGKIAYIPHHELGDLDQPNLQILTTNQLTSDQNDQ